MGRGPGGAQPGQDPAGPGAAPSHAGRCDLGTVHPGVRFRRQAPAPIAEISSDRGGIPIVRARRRWHPRPYRQRKASHTNRERGARRGQRRNWSELGNEDSFADFPPGDSCLGIDWYVAPAAGAPSCRARQGLARRTAEGTEACRAARVGESLRIQRPGAALTDATTSAEPRRLRAHGASGGRRPIRAKARAAHPPTPPSSGHRRARWPVARSWPGRGNAR